MQLNSETTIGAAEQTVVWLKRLRDQNLVAERLLDATHKLKRC